MAELSGDQRENLSDREYAYIDKHGGRHLPIHDDEHIRNAAARFSQTHFESTEARQQAAKHIVTAAQRHGVELNQDDAVMQAADAS
ncbi:DUF6582 domain-containing protein [Deinococcus sonorensis]|uniref:DUF6582 domain-containing protein n=2 Tax=Deinococcus sonorensis TaxID=309891 RepID=A0AAU7U4M5_9DEIO